MYAHRVLQFLGPALGLILLVGCLGPATSDSPEKSITEPAVAGPTAPAATDSSLPAELAGLSQEEICELMCQSMGGLGGELCRAMHAAGFQMDGTMHPEFAAAPAETGAAPQ